MSEEKALNKKMALLTKAQALVSVWVGNIFGNEIDKELFYLSFEVDKEAGTQNIQRETTTAEYRMRPTQEREEDVCELVEADPEEVAEIAMFNAFSNGWVQDGKYMVPAPMSSPYECSKFDELKSALDTIYNIAWYLFVEYEEGKPVAEPDSAEAWNEFLGSLGKEEDELFTKLGW